MLSQQLLGELDDARVLGCQALQGMPRSDGLNGRLIEGGRAGLGFVHRLDIVPISFAPRGQRRQHLGPSR
jgi:hypothetical protein